MTSHHDLIPIEWVKGPAFAEFKEGHFRLVEQCSIDDLISAAQLLEARATPLLHDAKYFRDLACDLKNGVVVAFETLPRRSP